MCGEAGYAGPRRAYHCPTRQECTVTSAVGSWGFLQNCIWEAMRNKSMDRAIASSIGEKRCSTPVPGVGFCCGLGLLFVFPALFIQPQCFPRVVLVVDLSVLHSVSTRSSLFMRPIVLTQ